MNRIEPKESETYNPRWNVFGPDGALIAEVVGRAFLYSNGVEGMRYYIDGRYEDFDTPQQAAQSIR